MSVASFVVLFILGVCLSCLPLSLPLTSFDLRVRPLLLTIYYHLSKNPCLLVWRRTLGFTFMLINYCGNVWDVSGQWFVLLGCFLCVLCLCLFLLLVKFHVVYHKILMSAYMVVRSRPRRRELFFIIVVQMYYSFLTLLAPGSVGFLWPVFLTIPSVHETLQNVLRMLCLFWDKYKPILISSCVFSFCHPYCLLHWPCILILLCPQ